MDPLELAFKIFRQRLKHWRSIYYLSESEKPSRKQLERWIYLYGKRGLN